VQACQQRVHAAPDPNVVLVVHVLHNRIEGGASQVAIETVLLKLVQDSQERVSTRTLLSRYFGCI
jgi:hypothetical protein